MQRNERLRWHRIQRNWRQQDLADQLQTALVTIQRWERGIQHPSAYYRSRLCSVFGLNAQELGLIETSIPPPESEEVEDEGAREVALWTIPYTRNPHFIGRDEQLAQLGQRFVPLREGQAGAAPQMQALTGLGGIGKTQTAIEYAYRAYAQGRYTHVLWFSAASEETLLTSIACLADLLPNFVARMERDQRKLATAVMRWLEQCEQSWLLIFDNADELSLLLPYLPQRGNGSILLTTRASAVGSLALPIEMDAMSVLEGTHLLLRRAQRLTQATDEEINEAGNLVVALGQFPLALDQAGAYIEETGCGLHDYLQLYQEHRYALLSRRGRQATGYPASVGTTWSLSFERVEQINPAASDLLRLCALLAPDHIPEELLIDGAAHWPPLLQRMVADRLGFNQLLETLLAFSLVKRLSGDHLLSVHRLVQVVQMEYMSRQEQREWAERLICAMQVVFPQNPTDQIAAWPLCLRYLEQAQVCDALIQEHQLLLPEAADVLYRTATYLRGRTLNTLAEPLYRQALRIREQLLGPEHPDTATSLSGLALLFFRQGKYAEAERFFERTLRIREQHLGPEHSDTAESLNDLALLYWQWGKYSQAEPLYQRALRIREQSLGPEHPDTAESLNNLALLYRHLGHYRQAEALYQRAVRIWEQQLGLEHPRVAYALNGLANLYLQEGNYEQEGKYEQTEALYRRALLIWEQQLGSEHPRLTYPLNGLANLYLQAGKYEQAEPLYLRAAHIWEQEHLGPEHPDVAYALNGLANLYLQAGKYEQAEPLYRRVLRIREQLLGSEHPEMAVVLHDFAGFQQVQGNTQEAASLYRQALTIRKNTLGAHHPLTARTRECLRAALVMLDRTDETAALEKK